MKHDWKGYGLYWALIEKLRDSTCYKLSLDYNVISYDLRADSAIIKSIINDFGLFTVEQDCFYSESLMRRMTIKDEKSEKARESANKRWSDANAKRTHSKGNASKGKKSKEEVSKQATTIPDLEEVKQYFVVNGYSEASAKKAYAYYNQSVEGTSRKAWRDGKGNIIKNWKMKMQSVWFKDEHKKPEPRKVKVVDG